MPKGPCAALRGLVAKPYPYALGGRLRLRPEKERRPAYRNQLDRVAWLRVAELVKLGSYFGQYSVATLVGFRSRGRILDR